VWKEPLKFKLFLKGKTVGQCLKILADVTDEVTLHQIEQTGNQGKGVKMLVSLNSFNSSKIFFERFERSDIHPAIEVYGRDSINF